MNSFFKDDTPHGFVKRHIFRRHCEAFVAKTQNYETCKLQTIIYDAFAGAGCYSDGLPTEKETYGSPLICLDVVIKYFQQKSRNEPVNSKHIPEFQGIMKYIEQDIQMPEPEMSVILNFSEANKGTCLKLVNNILFLVQNTIGDNFKIFYNTDGVITITSEHRNFPFCINIAHTEFKHVRPPEDKLQRRLLTFIDPFGLSSIPMQHVKRFIGEHREAFINFMSSYVNRFKNVKSNETIICELYGFSEEEKNKSLEKLLVRSDDDYDGINRCLKMYEKKLKNNEESKTTPKKQEKSEPMLKKREMDDTKLKKQEMDEKMLKKQEMMAETKLKKQYKPPYMLTFTVRNKKNVRLYHLIFITKHIKGFKAMKEAMNGGSQDADSLSMSDYYVEKYGMQLSLVNGQDSRVVAAKIFDRFQGQKQVNITDIENFIWFKTPYVWRKAPLKILQKEPEDQPRLTTVENEDGKKPSRNYTYPDGTEWRLTFRTQSEEERLPALHELKIAEKKY